jgi:hypothetical protein
MEKGLRVIVGLAILMLGGCATYETTLSNTQGQSVTCKASGKNGIVSGYYLRKGFEDCEDKARAAGYTEGQPATPATEHATQPYVCSQSGDRCT